LSRRLRIVVEYDGTDFAGWQRQTIRDGDPQKVPNPPRDGLGPAKPDLPRRDLRTIQATLEDAIRDMTGETVFVRGAGRTDAGVHADGQVASFDLAADIPPHGLLRGLNTILPADLAIVDVAEAAADFDARFSARGKVYRYTVWNHFVRSPRRARASWHVRQPVDTDAIRHAAAALIGEHDFRAFRASDCERKTTNRVVRRLDVDRQGPLLTFEIEATAFLKNMVRIVVGTLIDIGRGRLPEDTVARMLALGDRTAGGMTAPPGGLTLLRVIY
jgi:tRNA pseudouridine38-40 synthase